MVAGEVRQLSRDRKLDMTLVDYFDWVDAKTGSLFEVAEVFRDLYRLKNTKTLSFGERRMLDTAKSLIVKELSVAKGTTETKVERELEKLFSA